MNHYEAPAITARRSIEGQLGVDGRSHSTESDAEIKHGIEPVGSYEAPTITETTPLSGSLEVYVSIPV